LICFFFPRLLPILCFRICKKAGAERASYSASEELAGVLGEIGVEIAKDALEYMMHAGSPRGKNLDARSGPEGLLLELKATI